MANFTITDYSTTAQTLTGFDSGLITSTGMLISTPGVVVSATNSGTQISKLTVFGTLMADGNSTAKAVNFAGAKFNMFVAEGANVLAPGSNTTAVELLATDKVVFTNNGLVYGTSKAIQTGTSDEFSYFNLQNTGTIEGGSTGIWFANQAGNATMQNSGTILGSSYGIYNALGASNTHYTKLQNSGTIQGSSASYQGSDGIDLIANAGTMIGRIQLNGGDDTYDGAAGGVVGDVFGGAGDDKLIGGQTDDSFFGGNDDDILRGRGGDDTLDGGFGDDNLKGGEGNDDLSGGTGNDSLFGHQGADTLSGGAGVDFLKGGAGDDVMSGGDGNDALRGGAGDDTLSGEAGKDSLFGGAGDDDLNGNNGKDDLRGGSGFDTLRGGGSDDTLNGGRDDDILIGGGGSDIFIFNRNAGDDRITDFANGSDQIDLTAFGINPTNYASIIAPALSNAGGGDTMLDLGAIGGQGSVLIEGLAFANADASDFIL